MKKTLILFGIILLLFFTTFIFTRPAIFEQFDFSRTGSIGDTIGGITAPIINLISAFLIYYSFQEQVKSNRMLAEDRNFHITLKLFDNLKESYNKLKYSNNAGQSALNIYCNELILIDNFDKYIELSKNPIYFDYEFLISEYDLLLSHLEKARMDFNEKESLKILIHNFFNSKLEYSVNIFIDVLQKFEHQNTVFQSNQFLLKNLKFYKKKALDFK